MPELSRLEYVNDSGVEYFRVLDIAPDIRDQIEIDHEVSFLSKFFDSPDDTGTAKGVDGVALKDNYGVFLDELLAGDKQGRLALHRETNSIVCSFRDYCRSNFINSHSAFGLMSKEIRYSVLLSGYVAGSYYNPHRDASVSTLVWWTGDCEGGEFKFTDLGIEIAPEKYTGIIFPSWYRHEVAEVLGESAGYSRFGVSAFLYST